MESMSSLQPPSPQLPVLFWDGTRISVSCPESIMAYNQHMGGVDRGQGLPNKKQKVLQIRFYVFVRRGFDVAITNAYIIITNTYILYKHANAHPKLKNIKEPRSSLLNIVIAQYCSRRRAGRTGGATSIATFPEGLDCTMSIETTSRKMFPL